MKELTALAHYPNVAVKLTGGPFFAATMPIPSNPSTNTTAPCTTRLARAAIRGTDITKMPCSWRQCVTHFQEIAWIPEADKKLIMGEAICDWLGWKR